MLWSTGIAWHRNLGTVHQLGTAQIDISFDRVVVEGWFVGSTVYRLEKRNVRKRGMVTTAMRKNRAR